VNLPACRNPSLRTAQTRASSRLRR
jgi:hypothetical protein